MQLLGCYIGDRSSYITLLMMEHDENAALCYTRENHGSDTLPHTRENQVGVTSLYALLIYEIREQGITHACNIVF